MTNFGDVIIRSCDAGFGAVESMRRWFGRAKVETIPTGELQALLAESDSSVTLIDVRSQSEQAVSKIPGAVTQQEYEAGLNSCLNRPVVVYCTVGGRSYLYARKLVVAGIDAKNYRDGILGWCQSGFPLESSDKKVTHAVHPYWRIFRVPKQYEVKL